MKRLSSTTLMVLPRLLLSFLPPTVAGRRTSAILLASFLAFVPIQAQETAPVPDTLRTVLTDTLSSGASGVDTLVVYSAKDSIVYSMRTKFMNLYGKSELQYRAIGLKAERVQVNWNTATLSAGGVKDTTDKEGKKLVGAPVMVDGDEAYDGKVIRYNFRTKRGKISVAETEIEDGYYHGSAIKKVGKDVLFVADGRYTTCDADHPHYYFLSPKMKVIVRDHIVAEPIYFYVADVPLLALPFGVFPNKSGRRSGLIAPAYGEDARRGRFLSHFGYYWAISDYMDVATTFDWFTRGGWLNRSLLRYAWRYHFTGSVSASMTDLHEGEPGDPGRTERRDYNVNIAHNQQIDPSSRLDVNFTFASGTYFRNTSSNIDEILRQNVISNATYSKSWEEGNRSLTVNLYRDQNLTTGNVEERLPSLSFTQGQLYPFRRQGSSRGTGGAGSAEYAWYELIGLSYSAQAQSNRSKQFQTIRSLSNPALDSLKIETREERLGANHQVSLTASPKAGHFNISPFVNYNEKWYNRSILRDSTGFTDISGFKAVRTYTAGLSASTRFYGMFQPQVFGITGIRHTVTPNISFGYQPDFSHPRFGYYGTYIDRNGREVKYSFFEREIYGGAGSGRQENISLNVGNVFEMKYLSADTVEPEKKIQLLNVGAGIAYNLAADSLRLSPLSLSYRTDIGSILNLSASTTHDFYVFDEAARGRVNRFLVKERGYLADLTAVSFSLSTSLSAEKKTSAASSTIPQDVQQAQDRANGNVGQAVQPQTYQGLFGEGTPDFSIPWNLTLSYTFSQNQQNPRVKVRSSNLNASLSFNLTENWRFSTSGSYDFVRKEFAAPSINIHRDLHCWEMNLTWFPIGFYRGYRFELRVKAPQLQDLKVTKQGSERGTYY